MTLPAVLPCRKLSAVVPGCLATQNGHPLGAAILTGRPPALRHVTDPRTGPGLVVVAFARGPGLCRCVVPGGQAASAPTRPRQQRQRSLGLGAGCTSALTPRSSRGPPRWKQVCRAPGRRSCCAARLSSGVPPTLFGVLLDVASADPARLRQSAAIGEGRSEVPTQPREPLRWRACSAGSGQLLLPPPHPHCLDGSSPSDNH